MIAISNNELDVLPKLGKTVKCYRCGKRHNVLDAKSPMAELNVFRCKGKLYLCGINGKAWKPKKP